MSKSHARIVGELSVDTEFCIVSPAWHELNPTIRRMQVCVDMDARIFKIGDGCTTYRELPSMDRDAFVQYAKTLDQQEVQNLLVHLDNTIFRNAGNYKLRTFLGELDTKLRQVHMRNIMTGNSYSAKSSTTATPLLETLQTKFISQIIENIEYLEKELGMSKEETLRVLRKKLKDEPNNG